MPKKASHLPLVHAPTLSSTPQFHSFLSLSSTNSQSTATMASNSKQRRRVPRPIGSRPLMLKDFLLLDDSSSCSSSGFKSLPRSPSCNANSPTLLQEVCRTSTALGPEPKLRRSRSRSAAEVAVSALQKLLNSVKSPASRKKPSTAMEKKDAEIFVQVRVKDILRWRSFRDLIDGLGEEKALPLDRGSASPNGRSGLDAAAAGLSRERDGEKRNVGGEDPRLAGTGTTLCCDDYGGPSKSEHTSNNDEEQHSPVSVLDSPFRDDEDSAASFDQSLANVERTKQRLMESIKWLESLAGVNHMDSDKDEITDLSEEPTTEAKPKETKPNLGSRKEPEGNVEIEECVKEMDKEAQWSQFQEQRNQLGTELEMAVLNALLDELLVEDLAAPLTHV